MAYSAPSTRSTGNLITAAIWNADVVANPIAIYAGAMSISSQAALDFVYASSSTQLGRLSKGTALQSIRLNSAANAYEFYTQSVEPNLNDFRLSLTSAVPFTTSDVSGATTLYLAQATGKTISLYSGSAWVRLESAQVSISLSGLTASKPYDVFAYDSSGTLTLELLVWTNSSTRATSLVLQDGVLVKTGSTTRRYLGTIYVDSGGGAVSDTYASRHLWNYYHRAKRPMRVLEATDSWAYATGTWRQANSSTANQLSLVVGVAGTPVDISVDAFTTSSATGYTQAVSVGKNSTSSQMSGVIGKEDDSVTLTGGAMQTPSCSVLDLPAAGRTYYVWLEYGGSGASTVWYGDHGGTSKQSGIHGMTEG